MARRYVKAQFSPLDGIKYRQYTFKFDGDNIQRGDVAVVDSVRGPGLVYITDPDAEKPSEEILAIIKSIVCVVDYFRK